MKELFDKPKLISIIGNTNSGKSNLIYHIVDTLQKESVFNLVTFGLKYSLPGAHEIWSLEELENIENSLIITDETFSLFDLDNRTKKKQIEQTLRLLHHQNNVLLLSLLPENCKKFIASKIDAMIFKKCTLGDFINGSLVKRVATQYKGPEAGTSLLGIKVNNALVYDGSFKMWDVPYIEKYDSKKNNESIFKNKPVFLKKKTA